MNKNIKYLLDLLFSTKAAGFYLLLFAVSIGTATFIENDFGTSSAQALIYRAKWFELLLFLFSGSIVYNIVRFKMVKNRKWAHLIFHIAIIIILLGAAVTRYFGYEGMMNIREGSSANYFLSSNTYLKFDSKYDNKNYSFDEKVYFSTLGSNRFHKKYQIGTHIIDVKLNGFIPNPARKLVDDPNGKAIAKIVVAGNMGREEYFLSKGESMIISGKLFNFTDELKDNAVNIIMNDGIPMFSTDKRVIQTVMATQQTDTLNPGGMNPLLQRSMYQMDDVSFVVGEFNPSSKVMIVSTDRKMKSGSTGGLNLAVDIDGTKDTILLTGISGVEGAPQTVSANGIDLAVSYGAKRIQLPLQ
ncbi:MAG: cytochrome c biogenesis protein ResB [Saprospiraceae bacterium]